MGTLLCPKHRFIAFPDHSRSVWGFCLATPVYFLCKLTRDSAINDSGSKSEKIRDFEKMSTIRILAMVMILSYSVYRMERVTSKWPISELRGSFSILLNNWAFQRRPIFLCNFFLQNFHFEKSYDDFNFYVCELRCRPDWKNTFAKYIFYFEFPRIFFEISNTIYFSQNYFFNRAGISIHTHTN